MRIAAAVAVLLLLACAGSIQPRTQYLLRADPEERAARIEAPLRIELGRIAVAPYLDRSGIVVETEPGQVQAARQHEWAEPLEAGIRSTLRAGISEALGYEVGASSGDGPTRDYQVDVYVDRLHGTMDGAAVLDATYRIDPRVGAAVEYRFSRSAPLAREGYPGLVEAEAALVRELARAIAASLRALDEPPAGP